MAGFLDLPLELLLMIFKLSTPAALYNLCLVSRLCRRWAEPLLYRNISWHKAGDRKNAGLHSATRGPSFSENSRLLHSVVASITNRPELAMNVRDLYADCRFAGDSRYWSSIGDTLLWDAITAAGIFTKEECLKSIYLGCSGDFFAAALVVLLPNLERITLRGVGTFCYLRDALSRCRSGKLNLQRPGGSQITSVTIVESSNQPCMYEVFSMLNMPRLRSFSADRFGCVFGPLSGLKFSPSVKSITFNEVYCQPRSFPHIIGAFHGLEDISFHFSFVALRHADYEISQFGQALAPHAGSLRHLVLRAEPPTYALPETPALDLATHRIGSFAAFEALETLTISATLLLGPNLPNGTSVIRHLLPASLVSLTWDCHNVNAEWTETLYRRLCVEPILDLLRNKRTALPKLKRLEVTVLNDACETWEDWPTAHQEIEEIRGLASRVGVEAVLPATWIREDTSETAETDPGHA